MFWEFNLLILTPYPSLLDGKINFEVMYFYFLVYFDVDFYCIACKINFEIDFCRLKIQFLELDFSNLIFQTSSTDGWGVSLIQ